MIILDDEHAPPSSNLKERRDPLRDTYHTRDRPLNIFLGQGVDALSDQPPSYELHYSEQSPLLERSPTKFRSRRKLWLAFIFVVTLTLLGSITLAGNALLRHHPRVSILIPEPSASPSWPPPPPQQRLELSHKANVSADEQIAGQQYGCYSWRLVEYQTKWNLQVSFPLSEALYVKTSGLEFPQVKAEGRLLVTVDPAQDSKFVSVELSAPAMLEDMISLYSVCLMRTPESWTVVVRPPTRDSLQLDVQIILPQDYSTTLFHLGTFLPSFSHSIGKPGDSLLFDTVRLISPSGTVQLASLAARQVDIVGGLEPIVGNLTVSEFAYVHDETAGIDLDINLRAIDYNNSITPSFVIESTKGIIKTPITLVPFSLTSSSHNHTIAYNGTISSSVSLIQAALFGHRNILPVNGSLLVRSLWGSVNLSLDRRFCGNFTILPGVNAALRYDKNATHPDGLPAKRVVKVVEQSFWMMRGSVIWPNDNRIFTQSSGVYCNNEVALAAASTDASLDLTDAINSKEWRRTRRSRSIES